MVDSLIPNSSLITMENGTRKWVLGAGCNSHGRLHRTDGPAIEYPDGGREWYCQGLRHRPDGPAIEYASGDRLWFLLGGRHRTDGPAVEYADGGREWWLHNENFTFDKWLAQTDLPEQEKLMMVLKYG